MTIHTVHNLTVYLGLIIFSYLPYFYWCHAVWYVHAWLYGTYAYVHSQYFFISFCLMDVSGQPIYYEQLCLGFTEFYAILKDVY